MSALSLVLAAVMLVVGALGIANVTLVAVFERTGEIGLRRALGGTRAIVAGQFLLESTVLGLLGGMAGASGGMVVVVVAAAREDWTPLLDWRLAAAGPLVGAVVGLLAGSYPAVRAARIEPATAVRRAIA